MNSGLLLVNVAPHSEHNLNMIALATKHIVV